MPYGIEIQRVLENQGVVAALLVLMILRQDRRIDQLLAKICTLQEFIMRCFEKKLDEDISEDRLKADKPA